MQIRPLSRLASLQAVFNRPFSPMQFCDFVRAGAQVKPEALQERSSDLTTLNVEPINC
jgi:hypothetical protein